MTVKIKPPIWYWIVISLALVWNLMGVNAYLEQVYMSTEVLDALPELKRELIVNTPSWVTVAFAIAVFAGAFGCLLLLLRKALAHLMLVLSMLGIVVQMSWVFLVSNSVEVYGPGQSIMPIMILIVGLLLILLARKAKANAWIS